MKLMNFIHSELTAMVPTTLSWYYSACLIIIHVIQKPNIVYHRNSDQVILRNKWNIIGESQFFLSTLQVQILDASFTQINIFIVIRWIYRFIRGNPTDVHIICYICVDSIVRADVTVVTGSVKCSWIHRNKIHKSTVFDLGWI